MIEGRLVHAWSAEQLAVRRAAGELLEETLTCAAAAQSHAAD
jgi:hypothetical protein